MPTDVKWLRPEEIKSSGITPPELNLGKILESLIRCRELLKKHEWSDDGMCPECGAIHFDNDTGEELPHAPDCAIAAEIKGLPRGGE